MARRDRGWRGRLPATAHLGGTAAGEDGEGGAGTARTVRSSAAASEDDAGGGSREASEDGEVGDLGPLLENDSFRCGTLLLLMTYTQE